MRKQIATSLKSLVLIIGAAAFLTACNTVEGAGKDVSNTGHAVSKAADQAKP